MTPTEAEWVRANVWPEWLYWGGRLPDLRCPCEWVPLCERGNHEACGRMAHLPHWETFVMMKSGGVAHLPDSFEHPMLLHGGTVCTTAALVWLADRACHVLCSCPDGCHGRKTTQPVPTTWRLEPMGEEAAAWVRANVWTKAMRKSFASTPGFYLKCPCQSGLSSWCQNGRHGQCHRATPLTCWEDVICDRTGDRPLYHAEPHEHPTPSLTGPRRERVAQVWLADRTCRWLCSCDCGHPEQAELVEAPVPAPEPETVPRARTYELVELFDLTEVRR